MKRKLQEESRSPVTVYEAARHFRRSASQIRRWIQEGCPTARRGRNAKGEGALLDLQEVETWFAARHHLPSVRARSTDDWLARLAQLVLDTVKRSSGPSDQPIHDALGLPVGQIAAFLYLMYGYAFRRAYGREPWDTELPDPIVSLGEIARAYARDDRVRLDR